MAAYLRLLGALLCVLGISGSIFCANAAVYDDAYFDALRAFEKYPGNVLFTTEFKMTEPRHMLLLAGAFASAPLGLILGSMCLGLSSVLRRLDEWN
jgi:hypothetical protein